MICCSLLSLMMIRDNSICTATARTPSAPGRDRPRRGGRRRADSTMIGGPARGVNATGATDFGASAAPAPGASDGVEQRLDRGALAGKLGLAGALLGHDVGRGAGEEALVAELGSDRVQLLVQVGQRLAVAGR